MRPHIGEEKWSWFKKTVIRLYKDKFITAFEKEKLTCCGTLEGSPCKQAFHVDCTQWSCLEQDQLESLHIDHGFEVVHICDVWSEALKQTTEEEEEEESK